MQRPHVAAATNGPIVRRQLTESLEAQAVCAQRPGRDGDDSRRQAVEAVDQVDGVGHADDPERRHERRTDGDRTM